MQMSLNLLLILAALTALSAGVQGFTGLGFGLVGMGFCTYLVGPRDANVLWTLLALLLVGSMLIRLRAEVVWHLVLWMFAGALVGVPLGVQVLATARHTLLNRIIGATILSFAVYYLFNPSIAKRRISPVWGALAGVISGFFGGVTNMSGPPVVMFLMVSGLEKDRMKATLAAYFGLGQLYKLSVLVYWKGLVGADHLLAAGLLSLPLLAGMCGGMCASKFVSTRSMRRIICGLLTLPGLLLLLG